MAQRLNSVALTSRPMTRGQISVGAQTCSPHGQQKIRLYSVSSRESEERQRASVGHLFRSRLIGGLVVA